jgi:hypothetical protein
MSMKKIATAAGIVACAEGSIFLEKLDGFFSEQSVAKFQEVLAW